MTHPIGSQAPDSTWQVIWENRRAVEAPRSMSLSGCRGKVVVLTLFVRGCA